MRTDPSEQLLRTTRRSAGFIAGFAAVTAASICTLSWNLVSQRDELRATHEGLTMVRQDIDDLQVRVNALEDRDGSIGDVYSNMTMLREDLSSLDGRVYALEHRDGGRP